MQSHSRVASEIRLRPAGGPRRRSRRRPRTGSRSQVAKRSASVRPGGRAVRVVVGERVAAPELEAGDERAAGADVAGAAGDERRVRARRREQRHVAGHHHRVERAAEVERREIVLDPLDRRARRGARSASIDASTSTPTTVDRRGARARSRPDRCRSRRRAPMPGAGRARATNATSPCTSTPARRERVESGLVLVAVPGHPEIIAEPLRPRRESTCPISCCIR